MNIKLGHKAGSGSQRKPVTAPDSASSKSYARIVYGINDGHMVGFIDGLKSLILDNTPVQSSSGEMNITEVEVQTRWGTNDQDYLEGFPSVVNEIGYNNVEIVSDHNFVHYVNDLNTNAVGIRFTWGKIFRQNESNGDINGYRIDYAVDVQTDGNGFVEVLKTSLNDKTSSGYERYHRLELPSAEVGWEIRVRRLTPNATSDFIGDKMYLSAVAEIVDAKLRYPNTALIALKFDADKFGSIPKADFRLRGKIIKVPTNYDPETRTYAVTGEGTTNGIWDGSFKLAYTNNPVWIFYDLLLSKRYGLGERLDASMVDKWALYSIGQYCDVMVPDGMGGTEPRLTCNVYINSKYEAFDLLMQLASTFRGILHWDGASIVATADRPSDPVFTFTRANIIGEFNYSGTRARDRSSMISVAFDDPANNYKTDKEVVSDTNAIAEVGVRLKELTAFGCTSRGQAQRIGRLGLLKEQQELRMVTFTVGLDGYIPVTGKIIEIADPLLAGRAIGGRISVVSADGLVITLDREVTANVGDVLVANGDDGIQQRRDITQVTGNVVTVSAAFTGVSAENVWAIDSEDLSLMRFRVLSVAQNRSDDGLITFTISGVQHNPTIDEGADFAAYIEQPTYSNIEIYTQVAPTELVIGSENVINQGLDITNVVFSWPQPVNAVKYELEWRRDNGSWIKAPIIYSNTFTVEDVYHGLYEARIVAINSMDVRSLYTLAQPTIINSKFAEPPMLSFIQATGIQFGAEISWVFPARESQNAEYVEVQISYRDDKTDAKLLGNYAYPLNRAEINGLQANLTLWVKARIIDRNKVEGPWTVWVTTTTDAEASILLDALSGKLTSSQLDQDLTTDIATGVAADAKAVAAQQAADAAAQAASAAQTAANTAGTTASAAQATANTAKSTADQAKADLTALTTSTNTTATELRDRLTTTENGLTQEKLDRASGDDAVVGQLNTYKSSNDAALAAVQQKAEAATTASTSNAQAITNLTTTVNTKNRTYRQTTAPTTNRVVGDLWVNTTAGKNNEVRRWNGTTWDDLTDPRTAANATALSSLQSTVTSIDGRTTANSNSITQLNADLTTLSNTVDTKAEASAVDSLTARVTTAEGSITSQGSRVTSLENSVNHATTGLASKASTTALTAVDNRVTAVDGRITTTNSNVTTLTGRVSTVESGLDTKADVNALTALGTTVTAQGNDLNTKSNQITELTAGIENVNLRGQDLVSNGLGQLRSNKYWSSLTFTAMDKPAGVGSFVSSSGQHVGIGDEFIAVDPARSYKLAYYLRQTVVGVSARGYGMIAPFDVDKNQIAPQHYMVQANTLTTLAVPLKKGDTTMTLTSAANWYNLSNSSRHLRSAIFWNYTDKTGYTWPVNTYSRNVWLNLYDGGAINGNVITLKTPWSGLDIPAGTQVSNGSSGGTYMYIGAVNPIIPQDWTAYSGKFEGTHTNNLASATNRLPMMTAYVKVGFLFNRSDSGSNVASSRMAVAGVSIRDWSVAEDPTLAKATALTSTDTEVSRINGVVVAQGTSITNLQAGLTTANNNIATKADGSALTALTTRVTNAEGVNTSQGSAITTLQNTVNHATTGLATKASSAALTTLDNKVTAIDGRVTSNSSSITSLNNSLTTTNANVTAAQTAATNAMTAAGQKGKVIFGTTVPAAADQLSQNLWVDTTGDANTPKRWNGTAWVVVTDKVATDALAAANAASSLAATKADSSALTALDSKVTTIDGKVTTNTSNITTLQGKVTTVENGLATKAEGSALTALTTRVSTAEGSITSQGSRVTNLENAVNNATTGLASKASAQALTTLNNQVQHSTTGLSAVNTKVDNLKATVENTTNGLPSKASSSALDTLSNKVNHSTTGLDAIASKTTVLESDVAKALDVVTIKDTGSTNQPPSWYWTNYARRTVNEFKTQTVIGVNGFFGGTYCNLETNIPYGDSSGGHIVQTATSSADPSLYVQRVSTSTTAWGAWAQPIKDLRDGLAGKASASAVESLTTRVSTAEGTISSEATKLSTLSTTVGGHTSSISTQQTSINGLNAKATIQVAAGNSVGGISLGNNGGNVEFIVRSNVFAVAPPVGTTGSNKYMMTYRSTSVTLPNGTVVSEGLYLNNLVVDYIDASKIYATSLSAISADLGTIKVGSANITDGAITTAKIENLAVTSAVIADGAITTAKIGDLQVDTLKIKDNAVSIGIGVQGMATITTISNGGKLRLDIGLQAYYSSTYIATTMGVRVLRNGAVIRTFNFPATYLGSEGLTRFSYTCALPPVMETIAAGTTVTYRLQITDYNGNWREAGSNGVWVGNSGLSMSITELKK